MNVLKELRHWLKPDASTQSQHLLTSLLTMAWFVEARDPHTGGHLWRVSRYALLLAEHAGFDNADAARMSLGGFLHDLGKVGVPDTILLKPGQLTADEYAIIKTHPDIGMRMLSSHPLAHLVRDAVLLHHERPDGRGYPLGLSGDDIPEMARIVGICDAFDAMTSQRPYRPAMPRDRALAIIEGTSGTQFDAGFAEIFIALGQSGKLDHVLGHSDDGIPMQYCPMCGPTLVIRRDNNEGDHLYCRSCAGQFVVQDTGHGLAAVPTGAMGQAVDLEPEIDTALIHRTVGMAVAAFPAALALKKASAITPEDSR